MKKAPDEEAREELRDALAAGEQAERDFQSVVRQYVYSGPVVPGGQIPMPPRRIDMEAINILLAAWVERKVAEEKFEKVLRRLFQTFWGEQQM